ncbi:amidohydrolase family protein [Jannaschia sp. 2305UL9-9]|uniref:amidohydrolase family protein n=1 Tax=Jannaschia sp. 2305UL9-9 TaxID=3121638 RepID=UPI003527777E
MLICGDTVLERFEGDTPVLHHDAAVLITNGTVAEIGPMSDMTERHPQADRHGGAGHVVIPGLVNGHHHVGLTPFQLGAPDMPLELWFAARLGLRAVSPRLDTLYSAFEMLASGVTCVQHLHSRAPGGLAGLERVSSEILNAYDEIGMRVSFSMALRDQNRLVYEDDTAFLARLPEALRPGLARYFDDFFVPLDDQIALTDTLLSLVAGRDRQRIQLAPSNLHWLSDTALEAVADQSERRDMGMHAHVLETPYQWDYARQRTGGSAVDFLAERGLLTHRLTLGHGVWLSEHDIDRCHDAGCAICHNCSSNMRLKSGIAPLNRFLSRGMPVALGIDEAGINEDRDMLQEMRLVKHMHREPGIHSPAPSAEQVLRMATVGGAGTTPFGHRIGSLAPGSAGDAVLLDWARLTWPYQDPSRSLAEVIVHRARPDAIQSVFVGGEAVIRDRVFTRIDRTAVMEEIAAALAAPPDADTLARKDLGEALMPHVSQFYDSYRLPDGPSHYTTSSRRGPGHDG